MNRTFNATTRLKLRRIGPAVGPVCLGLVGSRELVPMAFEAGINFFFISADMHWPLYEELRQGLRLLLESRLCRRDEIVVAGVSYVHHKALLGATFSELIDAVPGLGRLDAHIAGATPDIGIIEAHRAQTSIAIGASFHDRALARTAIGENKLDLAFIRCNPLHPGAREDLLPHIDLASTVRVFNFNSTLGAIDPGIGRVLGLDADHWIPERSEYYRFAMSSDRIDGVLCQLRDRNDLGALLAALERGPLTPEEQEYLMKLALLASGKARRRSPVVG